MDELKKEGQRGGSGFRRFFRTFVIILILALAGYIYWKYYFPYTSDGVKSGYLNYAVRKGQLFKTYEGKLIQEGLRTKAVGSIQSNEFEFSMDCRGGGIQPAKGNAGDLLVTCVVDVPAELTDEQRAAIEALGATMPDNPRADLGV
jgi:hypothetical protein